VNDRAAAESPETSSELELLRELLVPTERARLDQLEEQTSAERRVRDVAAILPQAIEGSAETDPDRLDAALDGPVTRAVKRSVRDDPQGLADALFPIMGPAIRRAIYETVRGMIESTNRAIEASLSWEGLRWRLEAMRSGRSFAEVALLHSLVYRVEQLLLIDKKTGLLIRHLVAPEVEAQDPDMVSGMLTAIRDFVRDSFGSAESDSLATFQVGELQVLVEDSPHAALAAVVRGHPPPDLRQAMQEALEAIEGRLGAALAKFDGDATPLAAADRLLDPCLRSRYEERHPRGRGAVRTVWVVGALVLVAAGAWWAYRIVEGRRLGRAIAALEGSPGVVVTAVERGQGGRLVSGLRDPHADEPAAILERAALDGRGLTFALEPYLSLEPAIVERRRRDEATRELSTLAAKIEQAAILMPLDSVEILPESLPTLGALAPSLARLAELAPLAGQRPLVEVVGHTDLSGSETQNLELSENRALRVADRLVELGVERRLLVTRGAGTEGFVAAGDPLESARLSRRVRFRVGLEPLEGGGEAP
jgi:OOP family OmpA-OmpF porin